MSLKKNKISLFISIALFGWVGMLYAQPNPDVNKLKLILKDIKTLENYGYDYLIHMQYPGGKSDKITGEMFARNRDKFMYNSSTIHTMLLTPDWFYRANHIDKTVTILDVQDHLSTEMKERMNDVFNGFITGYFIDSVVLKHGRLRQYSENKDTVSLQLTLALNSPIKSIDLKYDFRNRIPVLIKVRSFYPTGDRSSAAPEEGITQTVYCTHYHKDKKEDAKIHPNSYFTIEGKKVQLKQYTNYKLISYL